MSSTIHDLGTFTALSTLVAAVYALLHAFKFVTRSVKGQNLPPGPWGLPILGESRTQTVILGAFLPYASTQALSLS